MNMHTDHNTMTTAIAMGAIRNHGFEPTVTPDGILFMVPCVNCTLNPLYKGDRYFDEPTIITINDDGSVSSKELALSLGY